MKLTPTTVLLLTLFAASLLTTVYASPTEKAAIQSACGSEMMIGFQSAMPSTADPVVDAQSDLADGQMYG